MHIRQTAHYTRTLTLLMVGVVILFGMASGLVLQKSTKANALSGAQFNAGRIIDDAVFYNKNTMSASQIQSFLNSKVPTCDTNGTQAYAGTTRAAYGASKGYPAPYTCLKDYRQTTSNIAPESGLCNGYTGASNETAATIVYKVSQSCGINPQVLLVMLQKEQSLVTDDWPWSIQYTKALGAFCPDSTLPSDVDANHNGCYDEYEGFFKQMYYGAHRLKVYAANPDLFNYKAGRNNTILWNPNTACGSSTVYIQNQATASLYIYTPYRPNQAALDNLYGEGDGCSSYGNRNFWRMFNDWFGSTEGSYLLRTTSSATVYLVTEDSKYPIADQATLTALYPMGTVKYVSDSYLSSLTTGSTVKRLIKGSGSTLYFFDAGIKLTFSSCTMVAHYGMGCGDYTQLSDLQINQFANGPTMPQVMHTTSDKWFYMLNGDKKEAANQDALTNAGISTTNVRLHESSLANLTLGTPVTTTNTVVSARGTKSKSFISGSTKYDIPSGLVNLGFLNQLSGGMLDQASLNKLTSTGFNGYATDGTNRYVLDGEGKIKVSNYTDYSSSYVTLPTGLLNVIPDSSKSITTGSFIKSADSGTVYRVTSQQKAPFQSWKDLTLIDASPTIISIPALYVSSLTNIRVQFGPTRLLKSATSATVYMIDGLSGKRAVGSFAVTSAAGISPGVITTDQQTINSYTTLSGAISHLVGCSGTNYLATGGSLKSIDNTTMSAYGFSSGDFLVYDSLTCQNLPKGPNYTARYVKPTNSRTVYYIENGAKRPFSSYNSLVSHAGGTPTITELEPSILGLVPVGASL